MKVLSSMVSLMHGRKWQNLAVMQMISMRLRTPRLEQKAAERLCCDARLPLL